MPSPTIGSSAVTSRDVPSRRCTRSRRARPAVRRPLAALGQPHLLAARRSGDRLGDDTSGPLQAADDHRRRLPWRHRCARAGRGPARRRHRALGVRRAAARAPASRRVHSPARAPTAPAPATRPAAACLESSSSSSRRRGRRSRPRTPSRSAGSPAAPSWVARAIGSSPARSASTSVAPNRSLQRRSISSGSGAHSCAAARPRSVSANIEPGLGLRCVAHRGPRARSRRS